MREIGLSAALVFSLLFLPVVYAVDVTGQTVCAVQMDTSGRTVLQPCESWASRGPSCNDGWVEWYEGEDAGGGKGMHAIALAALMSGKEVMLRIDENSCSGQWDHLKAIRVYQ